MRSLPYLAVTVVICILAGCSARVATAPKSHRVSHDPILNQQGGTLLIVDACVQRDAIGDVDDYFVITEAKSGAQAALGVLHEYIEDSGIVVRAQLIPFVCGALRSDTKSSIRTAESIDSPVRDSPPPFGVDATIRDDAQYVAALGTMSTFVSESTAVSNTAPKGSDDTSPTSKVPTTVGVDDFRSAAAIIKAKTQASSILYLGVRGVSRSSGKAAAQAIGSFVVGLGTAIATAVPVSDYNTVYLQRLPEHQVDGMVMKGALIDLETGQLSWSNAVRAGGDLIEHPESMANPQALHLLYHDIIFTKAIEQPKPTSIR